MKKTILLIEDDPKVEGTLREILAEYELLVAKGLEEAVATIRRTPPDLFIIDYDLKGIDGLQVFRQLHLLAPKTRAIMLSISNNISLAVAATKLGVSKFLRKPVLPEEFKESVTKNILLAQQVSWVPAECEWLRGESENLKRFYEELWEVIFETKNLILFGEIGIDKIEVIKYLHTHGVKKHRKWAQVNLNSFRKESLEAHFWATLKELMKEPELSSMVGEEDRFGTIYFENIENLNDSFRQSILSFLLERRERIDKEILAVIGVRSRGFSFPGFSFIEIPPLRQRKEDLPLLLNYYLNHYRLKFNKKVRAISRELLHFFTLYDFPGNYQELECLIKEGVLQATSEILEVKDIPFSFFEISEMSIKEALRCGKIAPEEKKQIFEKMLYQILLTKCQNDLAAAARFLDVPKTFLEERLKELTCLS